MFASKPIRGDTVKLTFDALPGVTVQGKLSRLAASEDPRTLTMRVEVDVANADGRLRSGMPGTATLELPR